MFFHCTYNFLAGISFPLMLIFLIFMVRFGLAMHKEFVEIQKNKYLEEETKSF